MWPPSLGPEITLRVVRVGTMTVKRLPLTMSIASVDFLSLNRFPVNMDSLPARKKGLRLGLLTDSGA
jgi:hypothetical protein